MNEMKTKGVTLSWHPPSNYCHQRSLTNYFRVIEQVCLFNRVCFAFTSHFRIVVWYSNMSEETFTFFATHEEDVSQELLLEKSLESLICFKALSCLTIHFLFVSNCLTVIKVVVVPQTVPQRELSLYFASQRGFSIWCWITRVSEIAFHWSHCSCKEADTMEASSWRSFSWIKKRSIRLQEILVLVLHLNHHHLLLPADLLTNPCSHCKCIVNPFACFLETTRQWFCWGFSSCSDNCFSSKVVVYLISLRKEGCISLSSRGISLSMSFLLDLLVSLRGNNNDIRR